VVTNTTGAPQQVRVRNHLELDLGDVPTTRVRFTSRGDAVYALLVDEPGATTFGLRGVDAHDVTDVRLIGLDETLEWQSDDGVLTVTVPDRLPVSAAHVLAITGGLRPTTSDLPSHHRRA